MFPQSEGGKKEQNRRISLTPSSVSHVGGGKYGTKTTNKKAKASDQNILFLRICQDERGTRGLLRKLEKDIA